MPTQTESITLTRYETAAELRTQFIAGDRSPVEYVTELLERAERSNRVINAFTETLEEDALAQAAAAEQLYTRSTTDTEARAAVQAQPLLGIPIALKEKHALSGKRLSFGLTANQGDIATQDGTMVADLRAAGAVFHARTTTPEFSCATFTHSPLWGVTRNPWDPALSPGGSSGGSGAAVAAGLAPLATASDIAGSTRLPAGFTGTVGYKAPYGRIAGEPPLSLDWYRGDGPMARTVADTLMLTRVMAGQRTSDQATIPLGTDAYGAIAKEPSLRGKRIALSLSLGNFAVQPEVESQIRCLADALSDAGAIVEEVTLPWDTQQLWETAFAHYGAILAPAMRDLTADSPHTVADYTAQFMRDCEIVARRTNLYDALRGESMVHASLASLFASYDVLLCPTSAVLSLAADGSYLDGISYGNGTAAPVSLGHYWQSHMTIPFNIANRHPVLNIPAPPTPAGFPVGAQLVGAAFDERTVFEVGLAAEALLDWNGHGYPALHQKTA